jgi:hypothetical protein
MPPSRSDSNQARIAAELLRTPKLIRETECTRKRDPAVCVVHRDADGSTLELWTR